MSGMQQVHDGAGKTKTNRMSSMWKKIKGKGGSGREKRASNMSVVAAGKRSTFEDQYDTSKLADLHEQNDADGNHFALDGQLYDYIKEAVNPFNARSFTNSSDVPHAFEGIAHFLTHNAAPGTLFADGIIWGLPIARLPQSLTWIGGEDLRPRDTSLEYPSWSWFSWEGEITPLPWLAHSHILSHVALRYMSNRDEFLTNYTPICTFDIIDSGSLLVMPSMQPNQSPTEPFEEPGTALVRLSAEICVLESEGWMEAPGRLYKLDPSSRFRGRTVLIPDLASDMRSYTMSTSTLELVGISECEEKAANYFEGREMFSASTASIVRALWVVRCGPGSSNVPRDGYFKRHGVAIVDRNVWDKHRLYGGKRVITLLK